MITEEQKENIITASYNMVQALVEAYGTEQGMKYWDQLSTTIDPYYKGEIFKRMLCGEFSANIRIKGVTPSWAGMMIPLIKSIRNVDKRRLTLKEAKEMAESVAKGNTVYIEPYSGCRVDAVNELKNAGFMI